KRRVGDPLRLWRRTSSADVPPAGRRGGETWRGARFRAAALGLMLLGLWTQGSAAGAASDASEFINVERLSARVMVAHWVGMDRWCNLTAIRTTKGLVVIDTEMSPRTMAPIKELFEHAFGRSNWVYVIST